MDPQALPVDETHNLIAADKVEGTAVFNRDAQNIGTIKTLMLNKFNGRVAYAVMSSGGFLGIGTDYFPIPWEALKYDMEIGGYRIDHSDFDKAPRYPSDTEPNWMDRLFDTDLRRYYGLPDAAAV